jgi:parvulin-like peptidyl-prolyl isomerase
MVKPFEDAAFSQKVNDIGPVVTTQFGYHIVQVTEHNQAAQKTLEESKDEIRDTIKKLKEQESIKDYVDELKEKAKIVNLTADSSPK